MQPENESARLFHLLARYAYVQELVEHRKVLVLGAADAVLADVLDRQGISRALFVDPSAERVDEARRSCPHRRIEFEVGPLSRLRLPEGGFDVAIIDEFSGIDDRAREVRAVQRALGPSGVLIACTSNPDSSATLSDVEPGTLSYYEFYGQLADCFRFVRMVGQCPIVGFTLADLAVDSPETSITFDSSLIPEGSEDAEFFIAFCSTSHFEPDPFTVVQVPLSWVKLDEEDTFPGAHGEPVLRTVDPGEIERLERQLADQAEVATREAARLNLELDKRSVTIAKLENHLREAREKAALEHNRVVQTKLALEAERKKFLSYTKEVEMDQRLQRMGAGDVTEVSQLEAQKEELEQRLAHAEEAAAYYEGRALGFAARLAEEQSLARSLGSRVDALAPDMKHRDLEQVEELTVLLEQERQAREQAEMRLVELGSEASRSQDLVAELARERAERKLAETRAEELQERLRAALTAGPRMTPVQEALRKAQAVFTGGSEAQAEVAALKVALQAEQDARRQVQERLERLEEHGGGTEAFKAELEEERRLRTEAEDTIAQLEDKLSQTEAVAVRLSSEGAARQRAEAAFGVIERAPVTGVAVELELSRERKARQEAQAALNRLKAERLDAVKLQDELDRCITARLDLERRLKEERQQRESLQGEQPRPEQWSELDRPTDTPPVGPAAGLELELERMSAALEDARAEVAELRARLSRRHEDAVGPGEQSQQLKVELEREREARKASEATLIDLERSQVEEISRLEERLRQRSLEVSDLEAEKERQADLLRQVLIELQAAQTRLPDLTAELERGEGELLEIRQRLQLAEDEAASLGQQLASRDREIADLAGEVQGLKWRVAEEAVAQGKRPEDLLPAAEGQRGTVAVNAQLAELERKVAHDQGRAMVLERERERCREELRGSRAEGSRLNAEVARLATELTMATQRRDVLEESLHQLQGRLLDVETRAAEALGRVSVLDRELRLSKDEAGLFRQQLGAIEALRQEAQTRCDAFGAELQATRLEAANATRDLAAAQACMSMLEEQLPAMSESLEAPLDLSLKAGSWTEDPRQTQVKGFPAPAVAPVARRMRAEQDRLRSSPTDVPEDSPGEAEHVQQLREELASTKERAAQLLAELSRAKIQATKAKDELEDARSRVEVLSCDTDSLRAQLERARERDNAAVAESSELTSSLEQARQRWQQSEETLAARERSLAELQARLDGMQGVPDQKTLARLEGTEQLLAAARAALDERDGRIAGLGYRVSELESEHRTSGPDDDAMRAELEAAGSAFAQQEVLLGDLRSRLGDIEGEVTRLECVRGEQEQRISSLEQELREARDRAASLEFLEAHAEEWADRLERAEQQGDRLRFELDTARTELQRLTRVREQLEDARRTLDEQTTRLADLEEEKKSAEEAIDRLMDHLISVGADLEVLADLLSDREELIEQLQSKIEHCAPEDESSDPEDHEPEPEEPGESD